MPWPNLIPFPALEPYNTGFLKVDDIHQVYFEECGNPDGKPVLFVHGGPGGGTYPGDRCKFDPQVFRIILIDQRGAGKSTPAAELKNNTTWDLVADLETLREHLGIDKWLLFGGSWGSTLCIVYAESHPDRVKALILRGVFTLRKEEIRWFYQDGAGHFFPDLWEKFIEPIPEAERGNIISAYYKRLTGDDDEEKLRCAKAWSRWECGTSKLLPDPEGMRILDNHTWAMQIAIIECHYFFNEGWFKPHTYVLDNVHKINHLPCTIIQGRYDMICPPSTAWELHKRWPKSEIFIVPNAGHSSRETDVCSLLLAAVDKYKDL